MTGGNVFTSMTSSRRFYGGGGVIYSSSLPGDEAPSWEPLILPSITCAAVTLSRRRKRPLNASAQYAGL